MNKRIKKLKKQQQHLLNQEEQKRQKKLARRESLKKSIAELTTELQGLEKNIEETGA